MAHNAETMTTMTTNRDARPRAARHGAAVLLALCAALGAQGPVSPAARTEVVDARAVFTEKLGTTIPLDLPFTDQDRKPVTLAQYFQRQRPVILNLGYYGCPKMCGVVLNGLLNGLQGLKAFTPADHFTILSISIDPAERPPLARDKKNQYLQQYLAPGAGDHWHFLTGGEAEITKLTEAVGFGYCWNELQRQYDHPAGLIMLSPNGKVTRYLYGTWFEPADLRKAVVEASEGRVGTTWDRIVLSCFTYDPVTKTYTFAVMAAVRIAGIVTVVALGLTIFLFWRRERRRVVLPTPAVTS